MPKTSHRGAAKKERIKLSIERISWDDLRLFVAAARHGSLRKAAAALNLASSTLTRRIEGLEGDIGMRLFVRVPEGITLTREGMHVLKAAQKMERATLSLRGYLDHDPDSIWAFERKGQLVGALSLLFLTHHGVAALVDGSLNRLAPPPQLLVRPREKPAGIYLWSLYCQRRAAAALSHCFVRLRASRYAEADLWGGPNTDGGVRFNQVHGLEPVPDAWAGLHHYQRECNRRRSEMRGAMQ